MIDLRKFFSRSANRAHLHRDCESDSDYHPSSTPSNHGLEVEYQNLIAGQLRRWSIAPSCVTLEVRRLGQAPDGFEVFVGMVRLSRWDRLSALRILIGLPLLETKVRKSVRATWLADFSHFGGLWLHASEHMEVGSELHDLIARHAPFKTSSGQPGAGEPDSEPLTQPSGSSFGITQSSDMTGPGGLAQERSLTSPA
jgi:hypothetical protein